MSLRRPAKEQPESFQFNSTSLEAAKTIVSKYPEGKQQSAVMALLYIAQRQNSNWIPLAAMKYIAKFLEMPYIKVYEVATFYTMYNLSPVGKFFIQVCTTTPCMILVQVFHLLEFYLKSLKFFPYLSLHSNHR